MQIRGERVSAICGSLFAAAYFEVGTARVQEREAAAAALLQDRVLAAAFAWFSAPTAYFGGWNAAEAW